MNHRDDMKSFKFPTYPESYTSKKEKNSERFSLYHVKDSNGSLSDKFFPKKKNRSFSNRFKKTATSSSFSLGERPFKNAVKREALHYWPQRKELPRTTPAIKTWEKSSSSQRLVQKKPTGGYNRNFNQTTRYTPTKVPAPLVAEKKVEVVSKAELLSSMKKPVATYLLFSKHTWVEENQFKHKVEESIIPKSLMEEEIKKPAVQKKGKKNRSKHALDKSLKGIFEEEQTPFFNRYFER